jgi:hypothetical protein
MLDWTYEQVLQDIPDTKWECAHILLQCVLVSSCPLLVEELAEFLTFDFNAGPLPQFQADCHPEDPEDAVLSTCPGLFAVVEVNGARVIQFSHFSVREFLISGHLARCYNLRWGLLFGVDYSFLFPSPSSPPLSLLYALPSSAFAIFLFLV